MNLPDCPLFHGSMLCNTCVRAGRDFRYTFCKIWFPQSIMEGCSLARTVKGVSPPTAPSFGTFELGYYASGHGGARGGETPSESESNERHSIDVAAVESDFMGVLQRAIISGNALGGPEFHSRVQRNVAAAAKRHGLSAVREYPVTYHSIDRCGNPYEPNGLIDVMWYREKSLVAAIEIDSCYRKKSILKLMASDAPYKFWICYGNPRIDDLIDIDYDSITVVHCKR